MLGRPLGTAPLATLPPQLVIETQQVTVRYASESFVTRSTDSPANTFIPGRINAGGLEIGRDLTRGDEGQFGSLIEARFGEIELNNADGALDGLINDYYADGRQIRLKIGAREIAAADRVLPRFIATGGGASSGDASLPYWMEYPPRRITGDFLSAQITINDRGEAGQLSATPVGWEVLDESSSGPLYQALLWRFVTDDEPVPTVFQDEFDTLSLDTALNGSANWAWRWILWNTSVHVGEGEEMFKAWSGYNPGGGGQTPAAMDIVLHEVSGGTLKMFGWVNPNPTGYGYPYLGGMINSEITQSFLYGTFEIRARFTTSKGQRWSIWMIETGNTALAGQPQAPEIDIAQFTNDGTVGTQNEIHMDAFGHTATTTETWTASNGAAWPTANFETAEGTGTSVVDVQSNAGRLLAQGAGFARARIISKIAATNFDLSAQLTITTGNQTANNEFHSINFRATGSWSATNSTDRYNGYSVRFVTFGGSQSVVLSSSVDGVRTDLSSEAKVFGTSPWNIRIQAKDKVILVKMWQGTEPSAWDISVDDTDHESGTFSFASLNSTDAGARSAVWDNLTIGEGRPELTVYNGAVAPSAQEGPAHVDYPTTAAWEDWHVYKLVWTTEIIQWWIDGVLRMSCPNYIDVPMHLMIQPMVGGVWSGDPDGTTVWPMTAEIDYVRVVANEPRLEVEWESGDAANDVITGRIHQYRYVDPDQPWEGSTEPSSPVNETLWSHTIDVGDVGVGDGGGGASLFAETWTGTNGTVWPGARWGTADVQDTSVVDIQSNAGRLLSQGGASSRARIISTSGSLTAFDLTAQVTIATGDQTANNEFHNINFRATGGWSVVNEQDRLNGYSLECRTVGGLQRLQLSSTVNSARTTIGPAIAKVWGTSPWMVRIQCAGTSIKARAWQGTEPSTWDIEATNADHAAGDISIATVNGSDGAARTATWDNLAVLSMTSWAAYMQANFGGVETVAAGEIALAPDSSPALEASWEVDDVLYGFNEICEPLLGFSMAKRQSVTWRFEVYLDPAIDYTAVADSGGSTTFAVLSFPGLVGGQPWPGSSGNAYPVNDDPMEGDNWSARIRVRKDGKIGPYLYVQNKPTSFGWMRVSTHPMHINDLRGRWTVWEQTCSMNTPGVADGVCRLAIDGEVIFEAADIEYRSAGFHSVGVNGMRLGATVQSVTGNVSLLDFSYWLKNPSLISVTGPTTSTIGDLDLIDLPDLTTTERNSLATYWVSWSDNVTTISPSGATGGEWGNDGSLVSTETGDDAANRRASADLVAPGTITGGSISTTPSASPQSEVSLLVGAVLRGLPIAGGQERVQALSNFATVYTAIAGAWSARSPGVVRLRIQTLAARLQGKLQELTYAGSGGENGTADLAGRSRPLCFGFCSNVRAQLVDPGLQTYQVHSGPVITIAPIYDQGVEVLNAPPPVTDFEEDWTGSNGAPWPTANWEDAETIGTSVADIQSNAGRLVAQGGTFQYARIIAKSGALGDFDLTVQLTLTTGDDTSGDQFHQLTFRGSGAWSSARFEDRVNGYGVRLAIFGGVPRLRLSTTVADVRTFLATIDTSFGTSPWMLRIRCIGTSIQLKFWQGTEPGLWDIDVTNADHASGDLSISTVNGGDAVARQAVWDNLIVTQAETSGGTDYPSYAALEAAVLELGRSATCIAEGYFRLGSVPTGIVTATVVGDATGGFVGTTAGIIRRMVTGFGPLTTAELDESSFAALDTVQPAEIGIYFEAGDQTTVEEAVERVAFAGGCFAGQDRSGLYRAQRLAAPGTVVHWIFDDRDIVDLEREPLPYGVPWRAWGVGYEKNWTIQRGADVAAVVAQARRIFLEDEYRYAFQSNAAIALAHGTSAGAPARPSLFRHQADAEAEALRLLAFYAKGRSLYRVTVKTALFSVEIGQMVRLIYPRWNLGSGRNCVVVSVGDDAATRRTELLCFG